MLIEEIKPARAPSGALLLRFAEGETLLITQNEVTAFCLYTGMYLEEERLDELRARAGKSIAIQLAARALGARDMSRRELTDKLEKRGVAREDAAAAADRMEELDVLREAAYAEKLALRCAARGWGGEKARDELRRRGIARELWDDALAVPDWEQAARDFMKTRSVRAAAEPEEWERRAAALFRRGFSAEIIRRILEETDSR